MKKIILILCCLFGISVYAWSNDKIEFKFLQQNIWVECTKAPDAVNSLIEQIYWINPDVATFCELFKSEDESVIKSLVAGLEAKGLRYYSARVDGRAVISKYEIIETARINKWSFKAVLNVKGKRVAVYPAHSEYRYYSCYYPRGYNDGVTSWDELKEPVADVADMVAVCEASDRISSAKDFVADAEQELKKGAMVFYAGDFNEPSHLDWTEDVKNRYDHNGCVVRWPLSAYLEEAGLKDAYRVMHDNPKTHPGMTFPAACHGLIAAEISWAPKADERDRIDMIYYYPDTRLSLKNVALAGPSESIVKGKIVKEKTRDSFVMDPEAGWFSDHKGVLATFEIDNASGPITDLRCEYQYNPLNIDNESPRFSWSYNVPEGFAQEQYEVTVASDPEFSDIVWTSGKVNSSSTMVRYAGNELKSHSEYYWKVDYKLDDGRSFSSDTMCFETAMMPSYDWKGKWISDGKDKTFAPAPMLRKSFYVGRKVSSAKLYISAAAYYKLFVNGADPDNIMLDPGYTHYDLRNLYSVYDITSLLKEGENVIATVLGSGFYNEDKPVATWSFEKARWRDRPKMIAEIHLCYEDGSKTVIPSDETWKASTGPYLSDNIYSGDVYDARLEMPGWNAQGFDDGDWNNAAIASAPSGKLVAQQCPPVRITETLKPIGVRSFGDTLYVFDFGKNISGLCTIRLEGESGTKVTLTHGELVKTDGNLEMGNINIYYIPMEGYEMQTDTYYMKGGEEETFSPMFSYHGFRYVQVKSSVPMKISENDIEARFFHTAVEQTGGFRCSNELFERIWNATNLSYLGNLMSIPTDCPQREKNGWTADAYLAIDFALLNYDAIKFYEKWIDDMIDSQSADGNVPGIVPTAGWGYDDWIGPVWAAAWFIIPQAIYDYTGDDSAIRKVFPACKKYLEFLSARENTDGTVTYGIGDWVCHDTTTPTEYTTTCYYFYENLLAARFARMLGEDDSPYSMKAEFLRNYINEKYLDKETKLYANGSQTSQGVAVYLGIVPDEYKTAVLSNLNEMIVKNDFFLDFGTIGSKTVPRVLAENGYIETVYKMADKREVPSWGAWLESGLTTLAETWALDMKTFRDASVNHVFLGDISAWMTNYITGITTCTEDGETVVTIKPDFVDALEWASADYSSSKGLFRTSWQRDGGNIVLTIRTPANTKTKIVLNETFIVGGGLHEFVLPMSDF